MNKRHCIYCKTKLEFSRTSEDGWAYKYTCPECKTTHNIIAQDCGDPDYIGVSGKWYKLPICLTYKSLNGDIPSAVKGIIYDSRSKTIEMYENESLTTYYITTTIGVLDRENPILLKAILNNNLQGYDWIQIGEKKEHRLNEQ